MEGNIRYLVETELRKDFAEDTGFDLATVKRDAMKELISSTPIGILERVFEVEVREDLGRGTIKISVATRSC